MNEARLPAGKEKELRKRLKLINDFHWGTGDFKSPSSQKKKWEDFLHKNGWQGDVYVSADELQKFVDYGEELMTGKLPPINKLSAGAIKALRDAGLGDYIDRMNESETFKEFSTELEQMLNSKLFEAIEAKKRKIAGEMSAELNSKAK